MIFEDRRHAGQLLAEKLKPIIKEPAIIYALPRGGVILGREIAQVFGMPLDILIPRKIGHPFNDEFAVAAVSEDGKVVDEGNDVISYEQDWFRQAVEREVKEAARRRQLYVGGRPPKNPAGKTAVIVDDGIATGLTMLAAFRQAEALKPERIIVAVPVTPSDSAEFLRKAGVEVVALNEDPQFAGSVGTYYREFPQISDEEVIKALS